MEKSFLLMPSNKRESARQTMP
jgi:magnesium-transporting ATPase (P-type)